MKMIPEDFHGFPVTVLLRYFMHIGDLGGKGAVAFGVLFVLLVVGVALKEVTD
jgi:heme/copper-type cytochrome/quinol oxidase subunit 4